MTWNIKNGGGDRLPAIAAVLERESPDVLALQELRGFSGRRLDSFAAGLGMTAHLAPSVFGQAVAVLVRPPLRISGHASVTWRLHHAAAIATIGHLTVVSTHLNPFSGERRRREATWLAARLAGRDPVLIAGDLNSLDPETDHTAALATLPTHYRRRHVLPTGIPDTRAMAAFAAGGFTDLWPSAGSGDGRTVPTTRGGGAEFASVRLDYVLAGPSLVTHAATANVVRGEETEYASDHYPVIVDFTGM